MNDPASRTMLMSCVGLEGRHKRLRLNIVATLEDLWVPLRNLLEL